LKSFKFSRRLRKCLTKTFFVAGFRNLLKYWIIC
jgi:hypothetical protein